MNDIDTLMRAYEGEGPGAALLVIHNDERLVRVYGYANVEQKERVTMTTNFRLASVTKQFTAAAILLLFEEQRLSLEDSVRKWLPSLPDLATPITIRHLLTHTSGLIDYEDVIPASMTRELHDQDVLALLERESKLYFEPGASYRYSNTGYALLALIVEKSSGVTFASFLKTRIFEPLEMGGTVAYEPGISEVRHRAFGYSEAKGEWQRTDQSQTSAVLGDGGIYSSIDDLAKWDAAINDERLLSASSLRAAFAPSTATDDPNIHYGFGWRITGETLWHSGETIGFRNVIVRWPQRKLTVIVLTNRNDPEPYQSALKIAEVVAK